MQIMGKVAGLGLGNGLEDPFRAGREGFEVSPLYAHVLHNTDRPNSPRVNPDLLQRSEVVALFNTLHRTTESLEAVDVFRKMYAETQAAEAKAVTRRKERQARKVGFTGLMFRCPAEGAQKQIAPLPESQLAFSPSAIFGLLLSAIEALRRSCRGCFEVCLKQLGGGPVRDALDLMRKGLEVVMGKEGIVSMF